MESFFGNLKAEHFHLNRLDSVGQLQQGLDRYIHYSTYERIKVKQKGLGPVHYRTQALSTN
tara:strand:- start:12537 stop:12719 length:183 start_codon:yes stop_codon:yes gene_type:complete